MGDVNLIGLIKAILVTLVPLVLLIAIYLRGKRLSKRASSREPYVSGHAFKDGRLRYNPQWLYYIIFFVLWDVVVIFILFMAIEAAPMVILSILILVLTMVAYPLNINNSRR